MATLKKEELRFLSEEYAELWAEHGVDELLRWPLARRLAGIGVSGKAAPTIPEPSAMRSLPEIRQWLGECQRCGLCQTRQKIVFGSGAPTARLVFVGEGPGADEDAQGLPFVGKAGQLLTKIIEAMGYTRDQVYIANVVKCRPPENRAPEPQEIEQCAPFLRAQLESIQPRAVVALGATAANLLLGTSAALGSVRGKFSPAAWNRDCQVMPTYHPAYLLRNPEAKRLVWEDLKLVKALLEAS